MPRDQRKPRRFDGASDLSIALPIAVFERPCAITELLQFAAGGLVPTRGGIAYARDLHKLHVVDDSSSHRVRTRAYLESGGVSPGRPSWSDRRRT